jgi:hypothetical protein
MQGGGRSWMCVPVIAGCHVNVNSSEYVIMYGVGITADSVAGLFGD